MSRFPAAARVSANKKVRNATPTAADGLQFRSKAEAAFWGWCKFFRLPVAYEQYKVELCPRFRYADGTLCLPITWLPDFADPGEAPRFVVECKGVETQHYRDKLKLAMNLWMQQPDPPAFFQFRTAAEAKSMAYELSQRFPRRT